MEGKTGMNNLDQITYANFRTYVQDMRKQYGDAYLMGFPRTCGQCPIAKWVKMVTGAWMVSVSHEHIVLYDTAYANAQSIPLDPTLHGVIELVDDYGHGPIDRGQVTMVMLESIIEEIDGNKLLESLA